MRPFRFLLRRAVHGRLIDCSNFSAAPSLVLSASSSAAYRRNAISGRVELSSSMVAATHHRIHLFEGAGTPAPALILSICRSSSEPKPDAYWTGAGHRGLYSIQIYRHQVYLSREETRPFPECSFRLPCVCRLGSISMAPDSARLPAATSIRSQSQRIDFCVRVAFPARALFQSHIRWRAHDGLAHGGGFLVPRLCRPKLPGGAIETSRTAASHANYPSDLGCKPRTRIEGNSATLFEFRSIA